MLVNGNYFRDFLNHIIMRVYDVKSKIFKERSVYILLMSVMQIYIFLIKKLTASLVPSSSWTTTDLSLTLFPLYPLSTKSVPGRATNTIAQSSAKQKEAGRQIFWGAHCCSSVYLRSYLSSNYSTEQGKAVRTRSLTAAAEAESTPW